MKIRILFRMLMVAGLAFALAAGCGKKPSVPPNYAASNEVRILLGKVNREFGLRQALWDKDGATTPQVIKGQPCQAHKHLPQHADGFIYFTVDPAFKQQNCSTVRIYVDYFDATQGSFDIQYNGHYGRTTKFEPYMSTPKKELQRHTLAWETAEFRLKNVSFENAQNGNADFRIRIWTPEFYVSRVRVVREDAVEKDPQSGTLSSVSILLGKTNQEQGLTQVGDAEDGRTLAAEQGGQECRKLANTRDWGFLYFAIDPAFKTANPMTAVAEVEYFDGDRGLMQVNYDQTGDMEGAYRLCPNRVLLQGSHTWKTATFVMRNAAFENSQNAGADFRIWAVQPCLHIRRVTVRRQ